MTVSGPGASHCRFKKTYIMHQKIYLVLLLWAAACTSQRHATNIKQPPQHEQPDLSCLKVIQLFPINVMQGKNRAVFIAHDTFTFYIYSYKDMILSKRMYKQRILDKEGDIVDSIRAYDYFVYKTGKPTGNHYDSLLRINNKRENVESIMRLVWSHELFTNPDFAEQLVESHFDEATQLLMEKYTYYQRSDTASTGTSTYFFSKMPYPSNLYSLWPAMDIAKKMRLYKCVKTHNQQYYKKFDILADAFTSTQSAEIVPATDTAMVMNFFRQEEAWQKNNAGQ
jgi:hypothetical protein